MSLLNTIRRNEKLNIEKMDVKTNYWKREDIRKSENIKTK